MALKIGRLLVQNGLITEEQLGQALKAQLIFGGRLGTNLVELGCISTNTLAELLSNQLTMPSLTPSQLDKIPREAIQAVSAEAAAKYMMFPLSLENRVLTLAMADPTDLEAVDEIAFSTGYRVMTIVAPELLVMYALEKFYDVTRANRFLRIADSLKEVSQASGMGVGEEVAASAPAGTLTRWDDSWPRFGLREAVTELARADKHHTILSVLRRCMAEDFERVVLFALDGVNARAWGQFGCRIPPEVVSDGHQDPLRGIEVPIEFSSLFRRAGRQEEAFVDSISDAGADQIITTLLETRPDDSVLVVPVRWGEETVCVAIGAGPREEGIFEKSAYYEILGNKLADAVEIVRLRKRILSV
jgi:hypothetical protein